MEEGLSNVHCKLLDVPAMFFSAVMFSIIQGLQVFLSSGIGIVGRFAKVIVNAFIAFGIEPFSPFTLDPQRKHSSSWQPCSFIGFDIIYIFLSNVKNR